MALPGDTMAMLISMQPLPESGALIGTQEIIIHVEPGSM